MKGIIMAILLMITGDCSLQLSSAEFHFVNILKNYTSAQRFCREQFSDLATVGNSSDELSLVAVVPNNTVRAWIGLQTAETPMWYWAMPQQQLVFLNWKQGEPNGTTPESCGAMNSDGRWFESRCQTKRSFVCEGNDTHSPIFVAEKKSWRRSEDHCRGLGSDLVSIQSAGKNRVVQEGHTESSVWIGLFRDTWKWSDGNPSSYRFWKTNQPNNNDQKCVVAVLTDEGRWNDVKCNTKRRFICQGARTINLNSTAQTVVTETTLQSTTLWTTTTPTTARRATATLEGTTFNTMELSNVTSRLAPNNITETAANMSTDNTSYTTTASANSYSSTDNFILIQKNMSWNEAWGYCRDLHKGLAWVHSEEVQHSVGRVAERAASPHVWLALRYTCTFHFWFWTKWDAGCYQNWAPGHGADRLYDCGTAGALQTTGGQHWVGLPQTQQLNFICYTCAEADHT